MITHSTCCCLMSNPSMKLLILSTYTKVLLEARSTKKNARASGAEYLRNEQTNSAILNGSMTSSPIKF